MQARSEQSGKQSLIGIVHSQQQQDFIQALPPNCYSEASGSSYSQSASSAIASPANHDVCNAPSESSAQSGSSSLKEHDYIGLADISSTDSMSQAGHAQEVHVHQVGGNLEEPDLRLGLGPSASKGVADDESSHTFFESKRENGRDSPCKTPCSTKADAQESARVICDVAYMHPHSSGTSSISSIKRVDVGPIPSMRSMAIDPYTKSAKRPFSDMVAQASSDAGMMACANAGASTEDSKPGIKWTSEQVRTIMQLPDVESKPLSNHPHMVYWVAPRVPSWHSEFSHANSSYDQLAGRKPGDSSRVLKNTVDCRSLSNNMGVTNLETATDEAPPAKEQVVGWPPVRSYRRSAIEGRCRPAHNEGDVQSTIYVKVNMDGIPIGRKVDLNAYCSYEELLLALEGMFHSPRIGESMRFLHAQEFVLTYEDKEGDWMLVGDVPWRMFVNTVRRLRIVHGSDSSCPGSSTSKNLP